MILQKKFYDIVIIQYQWINTVSKTENNYFNTKIKIFLDK